MGWDRGRYYTRSKRIGGRVIREYIGGGILGHVAAELDRADRERRATQAAELRAEQAADREREAAAADTFRRVDSILADVLTQAGYHRPRRGRWRRKRAKTDTENCPGHL